MLTPSVWWLALRPAADLVLAPAQCGVTLSWNVLSASHPGVPHNAQAHDKASLANLPQLRVS